MICTPLTFIMTLSYIHSNKYNNQPTFVSLTLGHKVRTFKRRVGSNTLTVNSFFSGTLNSGQKFLSFFVGQWVKNVEGNLGGSVDQCHGDAKIYMSNGYDWMYRKYSEVTSYSQTFSGGPSTSKSSFAVRLFIRPFVCAFICLIQDLDCSQTIKQHLYYTMCFKS